MNKTETYLGAKNTKLVSSKDIKDFQVLQNDNWEKTKYF